MSRRMSRELRIDLEMLVASLKGDYPYCSPDAIPKLEEILGYKTNDDGTELDDTKESR